MLVLGNVLIPVDPASQSPSAAAAIDVSLQHNISACVEKGKKSHPYYSKSEFYVCDMCVMYYQLLICDCNSQDT